MSNEVLKILIIYLSRCLEEREGIYSTRDGSIYKQAIEDLQSLMILESENINI